MFIRKNAVPTLEEQHEQNIQRARGPISFINDLADELTDVAQRHAETSALARARVSELLDTAHEAEEYKVQASTLAHNLRGLTGKVSA